MAVKIPAGDAGTGAPFELNPPQQARELSRPRAHPDVAPASATLNVPGGGFPRP
jgi:hypothetical protein